MKKCNISLGFIGGGRITRIILQALKQKGIQCKEIKVYDPDYSQIEKFQSVNEQIKPFENVAKTAESGQANMLCLAKIAIEDEKLIESTKSSNDKIIVLDGCPFNCADKILKREIIDQFHRINTTEFGIAKGKTPVTDEKVNEIIDCIKQL